jgi:selenocysteine-specific elongation factor
LDKPELFFTVCTAGHVDHGKTSVIRKLTGIDPDRLKEEKLRQMTTDLGFAHLDLPAPEKFGNQAVFKVGFIDVPGHGKFLKNMLAGVGCLDLALLVVAATESVMPQTRQHAEILQLLGVKRVLTIITKIDLASESRTAESEADVRKLLDELDLVDLGMIRVSCQSEVGFEQLIAALKANLADIAKGRNDVAALKPLFLPVDRAFKKSGFGSVITGTLARGQLKQNDSVWILPDKAKARVRKLESFGVAVDLARPGQRVAVNLALKDDIKLQRGAIVADAQTDESRNLLISLKDPYAKLGRKAPLLAVGTPVRIYHGTAECQGSVGWCALADDTGAKSFAHIFMRAPFFGEPGDSMVIRESDDVIMGGIILATFRPRWLNRANTIELLSKLEREEFAGAVESLVLANKDKILKRSLLNQFLPHDLRVRVPEELMDQGKLVEVGDFVFPAQDFQELEDKVLDQLDEMLKQLDQTSQEMMVTIEKVRGAKFGRIDRETFARIIDRLESSGRIKREGDNLLSKRLAARSQSAESQPLFHEIEKHLSETICVGLDELADRLKTKPDRLRLAAKELERQGKLRIVAHEYLSSAESIKNAHQVLAQIWKEKQQISPAEFKERLKTTRKYAMPLLSFFDDELVTRRVGEGRVLLKAPKS